LADQPRNLAQRCVIAVLSILPRKYKAQDFYFEEDEFISHSENPTEEGLL